MRSICTGFVMVLLVILGVWLIAMSASFLIENRYLEPKFGADPMYNLGAVLAAAIGAILIGTVIRIRRRHRIQRRLGIR